jgi:hypothetical protein
MCLVFLLGPGRPGHAVQESEAALFAASFLFLFSNILASHRYHPEIGRDTKDTQDMSPGSNGIEWNQAKRLPRPLLAWSSLISDH